jgi:hypothetical protein
MAFCFQQKIKIQGGLRYSVEQLNVLNDKIKILPKSPPQSLILRSWVLYYIQQHKATTTQTFRSKQTEEYGRRITVIRRARV